MYNIYYRCCKMAKDNCKANLILSDCNIVVRNEHVYKISATTQSETPLVEITSELHKNKLIDDK
ncbi:hypothetical protein HZS_7241 [Henneguya salminicola]|nr:hypothetical protein HZS_7241 [Henneguya salminicola]